MYSKARDSFALLGNPLSSFFFFSPQITEIGFILKIQQFCRMQFTFKWFAWLRRMPVLLGMINAANAQSHFSI